MTKFPLASIKQPRLAIPLVAFALLLTLLIKLGFWQLDRADEKEAINQQIQKTLEAPRIDIDARNLHHILSQDYVKVSLSGRFLANQQLIYDNQTHRQTAGYAVYVPFVIDNSDKVILVNRGWRAWNHPRSEFTDLQLPSDTVKIEGLVSHTIKRYVLKEAMDTGTSPRFPLLIQQLDFIALQSLLQLDLMSRTLHLPADSPYAFVSVWKPYFGSVSKHLGYAFQWFAMAFVLMLITLFLAVRKYKKSGKRNGHQAHCQPEHQPIQSMESTEK